MSKAATNKGAGKDVDAAVKELEILHPDREIPIGDEMVPVKEFTFLQGLKLGAVIKPIIVDLETLFEGETDPGLMDLDAVFSKHSDLYLRLLSESTDQPVTWLEKLNDTEGSLLKLTFWEVNSDFFISRVIQRKMERQKFRLQHPATSTPH